MSRFESGNEPSSEETTWSLLRTSGPLVWKGRIKRDPLSAAQLLWPCCCFRGSSGRQNPAQKVSGSAKSPPWHSRFLHGHVALRRNTFLKEAPTPTSSWFQYPISVIRGKIFAWVELVCSQKPRAFLGISLFLLHCLGTTAKALQAWNTLGLKTSTDGMKVSPSSSWCWRNVLGWWQSLHSHTTQVASDICCGSLPWHSSLVPWWLRRGVEINSNYFYWPARCYTTHPSIRKRNIVVSLSSPSRDISNRWRFKIPQAKATDINSTFVCVNLHMANLAECKPNPNNGTQIEMQTRLSTMRDRFSCLRSLQSATIKIKFCSPASPRAFINITFPLFYC